MAMNDDLQGLRCQVDAVTGADRELDRTIARVLGHAEPAPDYTASVDRCLDLVQACLPGWAWHVGWNASGVLPYATLHAGEHLVAAAGPTVPLALLRALLAGLAAREASEQEVAGQEAG